MKKKNKNTKEITTGKWAQFWQELRAESARYNAVGKVLCSYAEVFYPVNGSKKLLFSFQKALFSGDVLQDRVDIELSPEQIKKVFGTANIGIGQNDILTKNTLHIGYLTDDAWAYLQDCTHGTAPSRYVLYDARRFEWKGEPVKQTESTKDFKKILAAVMAAVALFN